MTLSDVNDRVHSQAHRRTRWKALRSRAASCSTSSRRFCSSAARASAACAAANALVAVADDACCCYGMQCECECEGCMLAAGGQVGQQFTNGSVDGQWVTNSGSAGLGRRVDG
jgi:hypothetical protein